MKQQSLIRPESESDFACIARVHEQAFGQPGEARLVERIRTTAAYIAELSLAAVLESKIVGHIILSKVSLEHASNIELLALAPLAILPEWQNQGFGGLLVREAIERADKLGHTLITVLGDNAYYERFGFETASKEGIKSIFDVPDEHYMILKLSAYKKEIKGTVCYPSVFDDL